jgi:hypothetical protein
MEGHRALGKALCRDGDARSPDHVALVRSRAGDRVRSDEGRDTSDALLVRVAPVADIPAFLKMVLTVRLCVVTAHGFRFSLTSR